MAAMSSPASEPAFRLTTFCAQRRPPRTSEPLPLADSTLVDDVVRPALAETERTVSVALGRINVDDMIRCAEALK